LFVENIETQTKMSGYMMMWWIVVECFNFINNEVTNLTKYIGNFLVCWYVWYQPLSKNGVYFVFRQNSASNRSFVGHENKNAIVASQDQQPGVLLK
jgi:hypothetical protein